MKIMSDIHVHLENKRESRSFFVFLWLMYATVYMTKSCFSSAMAAIVAEGSLTLSQTSFIASAFYLVYTPMQILGGIYADRYSPEKLITVGLLGGAAANLVIFFNQNYYVMLFAWMFNAAIQFALWPSVFKIMSSQLVRSDRSRMVFYMSFGTTGGLIMAYIVSAFLTHWQYNFLVSTVILLADAVVLMLYCKHLNPLLKKDRDVVPAGKIPGSGKSAGMGTARLFLVSGLFTVLPAVLLRAMVENGSKTLSPTMLMQCYAGISPTIGNLLNIFILVAGLLGTVLAKALLYPRLVKNEVAAIFVLLLIAAPFVGVLVFVGHIPAWLVLFCLCMVSMALTGTHFLTQHYTMNYVPYGKNGTVAGIINTAASAGVCLLFLLSLVAENAGWNAVAVIWVAMILISATCICISIKPAQKFKKLGQ